MSGCLTLDGLNVSDRCIVSRLNSSGIIRRRLMDIGIMPGSLVECVLSSPSGNPMAYLVKGSIIALRKSDSSMIEVDLI